MNILLAVSSLFGGGAEHVARKNLEVILSDPTKKVGLITHDDKFSHNYNIPWCKLTNWSNSATIISKIRLTFGSRKLKKEILIFLNLFKPEIIHIHNFLTFSPSFIEAIYQYKRLSNCKIIMTHHTYSYICTNDSLYNYKISSLCKNCIGTFDSTIIKENCSNNRIYSIAKYLQKNKLKKKLFQMIDVHISPSDFLKQIFQEAFPNLNILQLYNPCLDHPNIVYDYEKEKKIVYFGRISREKNIFLFAKKFLELETDYVLHIIGEGSESQKILELINRTSTQKIIFTNQFLNNIDLQSTVKSAKFLILPSIWYENSPVSIVEGINWGLIPIVSNVGGMKELIEIFEIGRTINPKTFSDFKDVFASLINDYTSERKKFHKTKSILNLFTINAFRENMFLIYKNIL